MTSGGRTWWAHFEFTRINIGPTILRKKIEELRVLGAFVVAVLRFSLRKSPEVADDNGKGEALAHDKDFLVGATAAEAG